MDIHRNEYYIYVYTPTYTVAYTCTHMNISFQCLILKYYMPSGEDNDAVSQHLTINIDSLVRKTSRLVNSDYLPLVSRHGLFQEKSIIIVVLVVSVSLHDSDFIQEQKQTDSLSRTKCWVLQCSITIALEICPPWVHTSVIFGFTTLRFSLDCMLQIQY